MKSYRKELWFNVPTRRAFINITPEVEKCLKESGIKEGLVLVNKVSNPKSPLPCDDYFLISCKSSETKFSKILYILLVRNDVRTT